MPASMTRPLPAEAGRFTTDQVRAAARRGDLGHVPTTRIVAIENTHNSSGGRVWPLAEIEAMADTCRELELSLHIDGARLFNAAVASGEAPAAIAGHGDTVTICFSKGLGCPLGAIVAGSAERMLRARRYKHQFGGAMRQAGIVAAACVYALDHHVDRLADDHARARRLAEGLHEAGVPVDLEQVETNFVQVDVGALGLDVGEAIERLLGEGVRAVRDAASRPATGGHPPRDHGRRHRTGDRCDPPRARRSARAGEEERERGQHVGRDQDDASCTARLALCEERRGQDRGERDDGELDDSERQCERVDEPGEQGDGRYQEDGDLSARGECDLRGQLDPAAVGDDDRAAVLGRVADDRDDHGGDEELAQACVVGEGLERADERFGDQRRRDRCHPEHRKRDPQATRRLRRKAPRADAAPGAGAARAR